jgi:hypothetical protein
MNLPCEECIVYALCKAKYSGIVNATIECEFLWIYIVEETKPGRINGTNWINSKERQVRIKRMKALEKFFPNLGGLTWGGDTL